MSRVIREPYEDCDLHKALMNTGYEIRGEKYYLNGMYTGEWISYYAPAIEANKYPPGFVRDWSAEPRYIIGRGGNAYPAEFIEMFPYTYGR
jgi:hypothetical protein